MFRFLKKIYSFRKINLSGKNANILVAKNVNLDIKGKLTIESGTLSLGNTLPGTIEYSSFKKSFLYVEEGAEIICQGDVLIAPGFTIRIKKGAKLVFKGDNLVAHNFTLICSNFCEIGFDTSVSWGCTFIDSDGHKIYSHKDKMLKNNRKKLVIGNSVGVQMNVLIPSGVAIGDNSIISSGTVLRQSIPEKSLAYQASELTVKKGVHHKGLTGGFFEGT